MTFLKKCDVLCNIKDIVLKAKEPNLNFIGYQALFGAKSMCAVGNFLSSILITDPSQAFLHVELSTLMF